MQHMKRVMRIISAYVPPSTELKYGLSGRGYEKMAHTLPQNLQTEIWCAQIRMFEKLSKKAPDRSTRTISLNNCWFPKYHNGLFHWLIHPSRVMPSLYTDSLHYSEEVSSSTRINRAYHQCAMDRPQRPDRRSTENINCGVPNITHAYLFLHTYAFHLIFYLLIRIFFIHLCSRASFSLYPDITAVVTYSEYEVNCF